MTAGVVLRNALLGRSADAWFTREETALYLNMALRTLRNVQASGALPPDGRAGRAPIWRKSTLDAFLAARGAS